MSTHWELAVEMSCHHPVVILPSIFTLVLTSTTLSVCLSLVCSLPSHPPNPPPHHHLYTKDFKAEAISGDTKVLNESGKEIPLPKK